MCFLRGRSTSEKVFSLKRGWGKESAQAPPLIDVVYNIKLAEGEEQEIALTFILSACGLAKCKERKPAQGITGK